LLSCSSKSLPSLRSFPVGPCPPPEVAAAPLALSPCAAVADDVDGGCRVTAWVEDSVLAARTRPSERRTMKRYSMPMLMTTMNVGDEWMMGGGREGSKVLNFFSFSEVDVVATLLASSNPFH